MQSERDVDFVIAHDAVSRTADLEKGVLTIEAFVDHRHRDAVAFDDLVTLRALNAFFDLDHPIYNPLGSNFTDDGVMKASVTVDVEEPFARVVEDLPIT